MRSGTQRTPGWTAVSSSATRVLTSSIALAMVSAGFMVPGLVRTKLASVIYGEVGVGLVGQMSQMQTLAITVGTAGVVSATRVILARAQFTRRQYLQLKNWLLGAPLVLTCLVVVVVLVLAGQIANLVLGSAKYAGLIDAAIIGVPFAVVGQIALAIAQVQAKRIMLVVGAVLVAVVGGLAVVLLSIWSSFQLLSFSFVAAPLCQLIVVMIVSREARPNFHVAPRIVRDQLREVVFLSWASLALGGASALCDLIARSVLVANSGLEAVASYQPTVLIVNQMMTIGISALATSSLVEVASIREPHVLKERLEGILAHVVPLGMSVAAIGGLASPLLILLFFSGHIVDAGIPVLLTALAGEASRIYSWVIGSCLLPLGLRLYWLWNGLATVVIQLVVSVSLSGLLHSEALAMGLVAANLFSATFTSYLLRRVEIKVTAIWLGLCVASASVMLLIAQTNGALREFALGLYVIGVIGVYMWRRRSTGKRVVIGRH